MRVNGEMDGFIERPDLLPTGAPIRRLVKAAFGHIVGADTQVQRRRVRRVDRDALAEDVIVLGHGDAGGGNLRPHAGGQDRPALSRRHGGQDRHQEYDMGRHITRARH